MVSIVIERKIPGQAMTPNTPVDKINETFGYTEQIQEHLDVTRKNAFPVKENINTNKHIQLTKARPQSGLKQTTTTTPSTLPIMEVSPEHSDSDSSQDSPCEFSPPTDEINDLTERIGDLMCEPNM